MIQEQTQGKWHSILLSLGVPAEVLTGKHVACPICRNGKDRFRFDDKDGRGMWICNSCGAGDGFKLLMQIKGIDFKTCAKIVRESLGTAVFAKPFETMTDEKCRAALRRLWLASRPQVPGDPVDAYLTGRGITLRSAALRYAPEARTDGKTYPAMVAVVRDAAGKPVNLHRTFLAEGGKAQMESPRKMMPGKIPEGAAVRLMPFTDTLGISEGLETALSASQRFGIPVWSAVNATMLEKWIPPKEVKRVVVLADNDHNFRGQRAAYTLANRLAGNFEVEVKIPERTGDDWNDA